MQLLFIAFVASISTVPAYAGDSADSGIWSRAQDSLSQTWQSSDYELYVPVNTWHNRNYYSSKKN